MINRRSFMRLMGFAVQSSVARPISAALAMAQGQTPGCTSHLEAMPLQGGWKRLADQVNLDYGERSYHDETANVARQWRRLTDRVDLEALVQRYMTLDPTRHRAIGCCPVCGESWDSLLAYCRENLYFCPGRYCDLIGDAIDFFARVEHLSYRDATRRLRFLMACDVLVERPDRQD